MVSLNPTENNTKAFFVDALYSDIRKVLINSKANACPMALRLAWHASGTYDKKTNTGGSNGATMRFAPESTDDANAGLGIIRDLVEIVKRQHPQVSYADLYIAFGCAAVEFMGGPRIRFRLGRTDDSDGKRCPANGRLPDAAQGAQHLRDVFHRMGFSDRDIVALSGAHTLGRCHQVRSGFDGPWTRNPLQFDNTYFKLLLGLDWVPRKWDGPLQYEDTATGKLMMLPTDLVLTEDPKFRPVVEEYAKDQAAFFRDFGSACSRLFALGCPPECQPDYEEPDEAVELTEGATFRYECMHGSLDRAKALKAKGAKVNGCDPVNHRTALHMASFWGHNHLMDFLIQDCQVDPSAVDVEGETALHDAARFGHLEICEKLVKAGCSTGVQSKQGKTALQVAQEQGKHDVVRLLGGQSKL
mmetsp:Transcript_41723/g.100069  ORF Transcript_41723/g.100069 Transcript_41723/m.100069 type:complete len:414 (-) Transcript_41723:53-1294(-)